MKKNENGFSIVEILVVIVIVGLLGAVGWLVWDRQKTKNNDNQQSAQQSQTSTPAEDTTSADPNKGYLVIKEWGLRFKVPSGLTDVQYRIIDDKVAFYAKPTNSDVQYRSDYEQVLDGKSPRYALGLLRRTTDAKIVDTVIERTTEGKKVGNYYYYTAWAFSSTATGAACVELYGDSSEKSCTAEATAFQLINQGDSALLNTIELSQ